MSQLLSQKTPVEKSSLINSRDDTLNISEAVKVLNPTKKIAEFFLTNNDSIRLRGGPSSEGIREAWSRCYEDYVKLYIESFEFVADESQKLVEDSKLRVHLTQNSIVYLEKKAQLLKEIAYLIAPTKMFDNRIYAGDAETAVNKALTAGLYSGLINFYEVAMPKKAEMDKRSLAVDVLHAALKKINETQVLPLKKFYVPLKR